jgi:CcmD family protein
MTSFVVAYLTVWAFVAVYVVRLRAGHQRLARRIQRLENLLSERTDESRVARAA